jgi:hypothetical protein
VARILSVLLLVLLPCLVAQAQTGLSGKWTEVASSGLAREQTSLTGRWQGQTPNGMSLTLDLVQRDETLTGTLNREGESIAISNGKVSKNTFTFVATLDGSTETIEGTVEKDDMKAWLTRQGPERAAVLKRVK